MWKRIAGTLIIAAAVFSATSILLWDRYAHTRPPNPDVAAGRIHPLNTHGFIVYLTRGEDLAISLAFVLSAALIILVALIQIWKKPL